MICLSSANWPRHLPPFQEVVDYAAAHEMPIPEAIDQLIEQEWDSHKGAPVSR